MNLQALTSELQGDPLARGYAALIPDCPGVLVDLLNSSVYAMRKPLRINSRALFSRLGLAGADILAALKNFAASTNLTGDAERLRLSTQFALEWLQDLSVSGGLDLAVPTTDGVIAMHVAAGTLTQAQSDALSSLCIQPASRAEVLGLGGVVAEADVRAALGL